MNPRRGEIWILNLDPAKGSEQKKIRPVVVISENGLAVLPLRIIVPLTTLKERHVRHPWMVPIRANRKNGLTRDSLADGFQVRAVAMVRFLQRLGRLNATQVADIAAAIGLCVGVG